MTWAKCAIAAFVGCTVIPTAMVVAWHLASEPPRPRRTAELPFEHAAERVPGSDRELAARAWPAPSHRTWPSPIEQLVQRLLGVMQQAGGAYDAEEVARLRGELLGLGEGAAGPILVRLGSEADTARRDLLLDLLRQVPGRAAESYLIGQARSAPAGSTRSIAMDALAERGSDEALTALADIAATDPELPTRPLFVPEPRGIEDRSTELPDEVDYTPRMKAMVALASTEDDRAAVVLLHVLRYQREESLRMRAAEHLGRWQSHQLVLPALRLAAAEDASRYVRLAALHALRGADDPTLAELLGRIVERDPDAGVRLLAQRLLDSPRH